MEIQKTAHGYRGDFYNLGDESAVAFMDGLH
jgi:hypothetical protein